MSSPADGLVSVRDGISLTIDDEHRGSVRVEGGGTLVVAGTLRGSLTIESLATVTVTGDVVGDIEVRVAGNLQIAPQGRVFGTVTNHGSFINRGLRAGRVEGRMPDDSDGGSELDSTWDGKGNYRLPPRSAATTTTPAP
jgi:cytoskeletal protein CcmA (bactofilin family)